MWLPWYMDPIAWARGPHISDRAAQSPPPHIVPGLETPHRLVEALSFRPISCGNPPVSLLVWSLHRGTFSVLFCLPTILGSPQIFQGCFSFSCLKVRALTYEYILWCVWEHSSSLWAPHHVGSSVPPALCCWAPSVHRPCEGQFSHLKNSSEQEE